MSSSRRSNLHRGKRANVNDVGEFETTASAFRQHSYRAPSSNTFGEDTLSADGRRLKRHKVNVPPPSPLEQHPDPPLADFQDFNFSNVPDMQWEDNTALEGEADEDDDELEDGAQKARRYASSVCPV
jgi:hypothetical protein